VYDLPDGRYTDTATPREEVDSCQPYPLAMTTTLRRPHLFFIDLFVAFVDVAFGLAFVVAFRFAFGFAFGFAFDTTLGFGFAFAFPSPTVDFASGLAAFTRPEKYYY
jgi:hypothetical protein